MTTLRPATHHSDGPHGCSSDGPVENLFYGCRLPQPVILRRNQTAIELIGNSSKSFAVPPQLSNQANDSLFLGTPLQLALYQHVSKRGLALRLLRRVQAPVTIQSEHPNRFQHRRVTNAQPSADLVGRQTVPDVETPDIVPAA
jgi:hypothetical protein